MADARCGKLDVLVLWACDRIARNTRHFLGVLDELNRLNIEFVFQRKHRDERTTWPSDRRYHGVLAELEWNLIIERVRCRHAERQARRTIHRLAKLIFDRTAILRDRERGMSLTQIDKAHGISRALVSRTLKLTYIEDSHKGVAPAPPQVKENRTPETGS